MKRALSLLLAAVLALNLTACGGKETPPPAASSAASSQSTDSDTVELTLASSLFEEMTPEEIRANSEKKGYKNCVIHEDGSVTYTMTREQHKQLLIAMRKSINQTMEQLTKGKDAVEAFQRITCSDDLTRYDIHVDREKLTPYDNLRLLTLQILAIYYQNIAGVPEDQLNVTFSFIDEATGEVILSGPIDAFSENLQEQLTGEP